MRAASPLRQIERENEMIVNLTSPFGMFGRKESEGLGNEKAKKAKKA